MTNPKLLSQLLEVVRFKVEHCSLLALFACHRPQRLEEELAIVDAGEQIQLAHVVQFAFQLFVVGLGANDDLGARLTFEGGSSKFHGELEFISINMQGGDIERAATVLAGTVVAEELLEIGMLVRLDHVHDRHALDLFNI